MELRAGERPHRLGGFIARQPERSVGGEGVDEITKVAVAMRMQPREQLGEFGFGSGGAGDDRDDRGGALESQDDVGGEQSQLLVLVGGGGDRARARLLEDGRRVVAARDR
jgi:hypothetical protein